MNDRSATKITASALLIGALSGCADTPPSPHRIGMANPASVYCQKIGGRLELKQGPDGTHGICHLPDSTSMEEWALFRRDHANSAKENSNP